MKTVGAFDAKTHLSAILRAVEKGETYIITRHGRPVAEIRPATQEATTQPDPSRDPEAVQARVAALRERIREYGGGMTREEIVGMVREMRDSPRGHRS